TFAFRQQNIQSLHFTVYPVKLYLSVRVSLSLSLYLCICLSIFCVCFSLSRSVRESIYLCASLSLSLYPRVCLSLSLCSDVFPQGLPDEYAFVTTFKFRKASRKQDWYIWQIIDKYGIPQVSIRLDGENKMVEYNAVGLSTDAVRAVFRHRDVAHLFDRNWHKLAVSVGSSSVALYIDCQLVGTLPLEERENIDIRGKTVIGKRLYDSVPIDFELQRMVIYCDARDAELETCCDLPSNPVSNTSPPASWSCLQVPSLPGELPTSMTCFLPIRLPASSAGLVLASCLPLEPLGPPSAALVSAAMPRSLEPPYPIPTPLSDHD
uniref:Thrombospondin-like N-terminal domain-containing protein n=1 Tax=Callorhinchus milii TaxID=7868 RepID=A0A4W3GTU2_CALMI